MSLKVRELTKAMLAAAKGELVDSWPEVKEYAAAEAKKTAQTLVMIEKLSLQGKITKQQAKIHLRMQKNSALAVLLTLEGLGILAVENAINAALKAIQDSVNTAVGFALI